MLKRLLVLSLIFFFQLSFGLQDFTVTKSLRFGISGDVTLLDAARDSSTGDLYIAGNYLGNTDLNMNSTNQAAFLAKYQWPNYTTLMWSKSFTVNTNMSSPDTVNSIALDSNGNIVSVGTYQKSLSFDGQQIYTNATQGGFIVQYSRYGTYLWSRSFGTKGVNVATAVAVGADDSIYVTGRFQGPANFGGGSISGGSTQWFIAKYSSNGTHLWSSSLAYTRKPRTITVDTDQTGDVLVAGETLGGLVAAARLAANGTLLWSDSFGVANSSYTSADFNTLGDLSLGGFVDGYNIGPAYVSTQAQDGYQAVYSSDMTVKNAVLYQTSLNDSVNVLSYGEGNWLYVAGSYSSTWNSYPYFPNPGSVPGAYVIVTDEALNRQYGLSFQMSAGSLHPTAILPIPNRSQFLLLGWYSDGSMQVNGSEFFPSASGVDSFLIEFSAGNLPSPSPSPNPSASPSPVAYVDVYLEGTKPIGDDDGIEVSVVDVVQDSEGNLILMGSFKGSGNATFGTESFPAGTYYQMFLVKYDSSNSRNFLWAVAGYGYYLYTSALASDTQNNLIVVGSFQKNATFEDVTFSRQSLSPFMVKYNSTGGLVWALAGDCTQYSEIYDVAVAENDSLVFILYMNGGSCYFDGVLFAQSSSEAYVITKITSSGSLIWATPTTCSLNSLAVDSAYNIIAVGLHWSNFSAGNCSLTSGIGAVIKFSGATGIPSWCNGLPEYSSGKGFDVAVDGQDSFYVTGQAYKLMLPSGNISYGNEDIFLTKFAKDGTQVWKKLFGSETGESIEKIAVGYSNKLYALGQYSKPFSFGRENLTATAGLSTFFVRFDTNGNCEWQNSLIGDWTSARSVYTSLTSSVISYTGTYKSTATVSGVSFTTSNSVPDTWVAEFRLPSPSPTPTVTPTATPSATPSPVATPLSMPLINKLEFGSNRSTESPYHIARSEISGTISVVGTCDNNGSYGGEPINSCQTAFGVYSPSLDYLWGRGFTSGTLLQSFFDHEDNLVVVGFFYDSFVLEEANISVTSRGDADLLILKYSLNGTLLWNILGASDLIEATSAGAVTTGGNYILGGTFEQNITFGNCFLEAEDSATRWWFGKFSPDGNCLWLKGNYPTEFSAPFLSLDPTTNEIILAGTGMGSFWLNGSYVESQPYGLTIKHDSKGNYLWHNLQQYSFLSYVEVDSKGQVYAGISSVSSQGVLVALHSNGSFLWDFVIDMALIKAISVGHNNVFFTGIYAGDVSVAGHPFPTPNLMGLFTLLVDSNGKYLWHVAEPSDTFAQGVGVAAYPDVTGALVLAAYQGSFSLDGFNFSSDSSTNGAIMDFRQVPSPTPSVTPTLSPSRTCTPSASISPTQSSRTSNSKKEDSTDFLIAAIVAPVGGAILLIAEIAVGIYLLRRRRANEGEF